jgi:PAS domain S-box-containing protein
MPFCTAADLRGAWRYARRDAADNFVFDVIDYEDVAHNLPHIVKRLEREIEGGQYTPTPLLSVDVPKNGYSVRPGAIVSLIDLIVLYALVRRIAPALDAKLTPAVFSYRWLPEAKEPRRPLFTETDENEADDVLPKAPLAPYPPFAGAVPAGWFRGWLEYHERGKDSAARHNFCAVADVTAYFENVAIISLFDRIGEILGPEYAGEVARLRRLYEFWGWQPAGATARGKVLPQGNDVSLFLSNFFLTDLDRAIAEFTRNDVKRYQRYVDDIRIFADNVEEGRQALLACDRVLRDLSLSLNPEKTRVLPTTELFDAEAERWLEAISLPDPEGTEKARAFIETQYRTDDSEKWERVYLRALTALQRADDDSGVPTSLQLFLENPSYKLLVKNFDYLSHFASRHEFAAALAERLGRETFTFPYHKHFLYRLAAYGREDAPAIREIALREARRGETEWYVRTAALFCLNSFSLSSGELDEIKWLAERESHPVVARAALVTLRQRPMDEISSAEDHVLLATTPGQTDLREYFFRVSTEEDLGRSVLTEIRKTDIAARAFINRLHQLDLLRSNAAVGDEYRELLERTSDLCLPNWPRLRSRLRGISELATVSSLHRFKTRKIAHAHQQLENVLQRSREAVIITEAHGEIQVWNDAASSLLGYERGETLGRDLTRILEPAGGFTSADELLAFVAESGGSLTEEVVPYRRRDGVSLTLSATYSVITDAAGEIAGLSILIRDVTGEIRAAKAERFQAAAEKLLSETSVRFVAPPNVDEAIIQTLAEMAALLGTKRAYVFRVSGSGTLLDITHEATAPAVPSLRDAGHKIELNRLPLLKYQLLGRYVAVAGDAETLPPPEQGELRRRGARAALGVPFHVGSQLAGFVGCDDTERARAWEPDEINLLRSITALISKALERIEAEEALRKKSYDLSKRVEEINCLFTVSKLAADTNATLDVLIQRAVDVIRRSWQYPEITCARIVISDREFSAGPCPPAQAVATQTATIEVRGKPLGRVEVGYCEGRPERYEGPFLREERYLIDAVAQYLGKTVEAKRAEEALCKSEREKTSILGSMAELVNYLSTDLNIVWANAAAAERAGVTPQEMVGRHCYEVWYGREEPCKNCHVKVVSETGNPQERETTYVDGSIWKVRCSPVRDETGKIVGIVEVSLDITEQKHAEDSIRRRAENLRAVNNFSLELASAPSTEDIHRMAAERLRALTGALAVATSSYECDRRELRVRHISAPGAAIQKASKILGVTPYDIRTPVDEAMSNDMLSSPAKTIDGFYELTSGVVPRAVGKAVEKALGISSVCGAVLRHGGELLGSAVVLMPRGREALSFEVLENYANVTAAALKRKKAEEALAYRVESLKIVNDMAIELAVAASTAEIYAIICTKLKAITGAVATITTSYDEDAEELALNYIVAESKTVKKGNKILGVDINKLRFPAQRYELSKNSSDRVVIFNNIPEQAYKIIPKKVCGVIERAFNLGPIYELLLHQGGRMMGTAEAVMPKGSPPLSVSTLETFAHVAAAALQNKQAEEAYRESQTRYKSLVDTMNEGFSIQNVDGVITYVNDRFCEMLGYSREELLGRPATDFLDGANAKIMRDQTARRGKTPGENYDIVWAAQDGRHVHTIVSPGVLRDAGGCYVGSYATITDITGRKHAEERVKESEKKYKDIVELAPGGIVTFDLKGVVTSCNTAFATLAGCPRNDIVGKRFSEIPTVGARDVPKYARAFRLALKGKFGRPLQFEWVRSDGTIRIGEARLDPMRQGAHTTGVQLTAADITARKRAEDTLRRRVRETAAVNEMALALTAAESTANLYRDICVWLKRITGALTTTVVSCGPTSDNFTIEHVAAPKNVLAKINKILGKDVRRLEFLFNERRRAGLISGKIIKSDAVPGDISDVIPEEAARALEDDLGIGESYILPFVHAGELTGFGVAVMRKGDEPLLADTLEGIANAGAAALRRMKAEEALRDSEYKYRLLFEAAPFGVAVTDPEGNLITANRYALGSFGYNEAEIKKVDVSHFYTDPADRKRLLKEMREKGTVRDFETHFKKKDGSVCTTLINAAPILMQGRSAFLSTVRDVTPEKQAERARRENEEKYRSLFEQSLQGILIADHERVISVNRAFAEMVGYASRDLVGLPPERIVELTVHPDDREAVQGRFRNCLHGSPIPYSYEFRSLRKDGSLRWFEIHSGRITLAGRPAVQATFIDITGRKQSEENLRASEQRLRSFFYDAPLGYKSLDEKGRLVDVNQPWLDMLGYAREEIIGRPLTDFLASRHKELFRKSFAAFKETGEAHNLEFEMVRKDGSRLLAVCDGRVVYDDRRDFLRFHCIVRNVTELHHAQEDLAEAEVRLNEILELVTDGITLVNPENVIVFASREFAASLGYEPRELKGVSLGKLMPPGESKHRVETGHGRKSGPVEYNAILLHRDGSPKRLTIYSKPLTTDDGGLVGTIKKIVGET